MKRKNGITLIALIITIIILLILAVVTIGTLNKNGIIGYAQDFTSEYITAQEKEKIDLAYDEYLIGKYQNVGMQSSMLSIPGAEIEPIGEWGWKVTYTDTGNSYGINLKGEQDEALTMIIEASKDTGVSVDKFIIFEDKQAVKKNLKNANVAGYEKIPERYVFYNWGTVTEEERKVLELYNPTTPSTELVENKTNRMLIIDTNGDGQVIYMNWSGRDEKYEKADNYVVEFFEISEFVGKMSNEIHNFYAKICYDTNGISIYEKIPADIFKYGSFCFLWDWEYNGLGENMSETEHDSYICCIAEGLTEEDIPAAGSLNTFKNDIIDTHVYYNSPRYEKDFK